jgi:8-amino-7-oxononanoate synthase
MQHALSEWLSGKLEERKAKNIFRSLPGENRLIDFTSNDYLGFARSETLFHSIQQRLHLLPKMNGSGGSRLLSGNSFYAEEVENKLANIFQSRAALIFNSGYSANLAVLSSIPQKGDTIIYDELAHTSIKDGARLSMAKRFNFRHNDLSDLEHKIKRSQGKVFIAVESVYSMDGDECPLHELTRLAEKYGACIVLDEAHTTGVVGQLGAGLSAEQRLADKIDVRIYTFGKAMGIHGACVAGSEKLVKYLINFARPFIYTTAPSTHMIASVECAFDHLSGNMNLQQLLKDKILLYLSGVRKLENRTDSRSPIQTIIFPGSENVRVAAAALQGKGFDVRPILYPTVPKDSERLRICLHTFNEDGQIVALTNALAELG